MVQRLRLTLIFLLRMALYSVPLGSEGNIFIRKRSVRCPWSLWLMIISFMGITLQ